MSDAPFRPFESALPHDEALSILQSATAGAEDGELYVERRKSESLVFDDGRLRTASYDASEGFGLRAVQGEVAGYAHSTDVSIPATETRGRDCTAGRWGRWWDAGRGTPVHQHGGSTTDEDPIDSAAFPVKIETLREIDAFARDMDPRVVQVSAMISARCSRGRDSAP